MIEKYGLFDSLEGDEREYAEADLAQLVKALGADGVRGGENALKVSPAATGLGVTVEAGLAIVQGRYYALEDDGSGAMTLTLPTAAANPRIDRIVLTLNFAQRTVTLGVLAGTEAVTPVAPALSRNTGRYMLSLAQVRVGVGAAALDAADITDERGDEAVCGLFIASADAAMARAQAAASAAAKAQAAANSANTAAKNAQQTANAGVSRAENALAEAKKRIPLVTGATEGHMPVFDANGGVKSSGKALSAFTRATMTLSGTTLTITTLP